MFIGPCIIVIVEEWKTNLMSLAILFHFLCAQHVSDINISIIRSLRLCWWITTSVVLFCKEYHTQTNIMITKYNRYLSESIKIHLPTTTKRQNTSHQTHTTIHRKFTLTLIRPSLQNKTTDVVIQQHSRKLLMIDILMSETCWAHKTWNKIASDIKLVFHSSFCLYSSSL